MIIFPQETADLLLKMDKQWIEITTPYLDRHNDYLQIYVRKENSSFLITDGGYIIQDLLNCGFNFEGSRRQELLKLTLAGFGVNLDKDQLTVKASSDDFPFKKHSLVQAMLAINDLFYLSTSHTTSLFFEDVCYWMDNANIRYVARVKFAGKSGYDQMFDFIIPRSQQSPERVVQTINNPKKEAVLQLVTKWIDTRETRPSDSKLFAILNDSSQKVPHGVIDALENYDLKPILWSEREKAKETLVA